ncbi:MAG: Obg family GTPase CgtA [Candidatus Omnitrophica bacterium]|nr:Obg family GTPase CgtA [Candidatus Omnitrophota bacterium]
MFIDQVKIFVKGGPGGKGCNSLYKDKYTRDGIRDGGSGGKGGDIIVRADRNLRTLLDFKYNRHFYAHKGGDGSSKGSAGKDAPPLIVRVPCGVIIKDVRTDCILGTLDHDKEELLVSRGGKGGLGNRYRPESTPAEIPEERELIFDLKLIADVGLVGFPNAGKSTLISKVSNAHPAIGAYPFTTQTPVLGVVNTDESRFVIADIPGLIEGSSHGRGLGDRFLRHIERTKILVHVIDMSGCEGRDPLEDFKVINRELKNYSKEVAKKIQILVANKMDIEASAENLRLFKQAVKKKIYPISALHKEGLEALIGAIEKRV